jgi:hypothetical protein
VGKSLIVACAIRNDNVQCFFTQANHSQVSIALSPEGGAAAITSISTFAPLGSAAT